MEIEPLENRTRDISDKFTEVEHELFRTITERRTQCLSQAQYNTGYSLHELRHARDVLLKCGLIRPVARHTELNPEYASYEVAV